MGSEMSLATLTEVLKQWKIEVAAVRLNSDQLATIDMPAIVHLKTSNNLGYFAMVKKYENETVTYFDSKEGIVSEPYSLFSQKWDGVTLLAAAHDDSGEPNYASTRRHELISYGQTWFPAVGTIFCLIWGLFLPMTFTELMFVLVKATGLAVSIFLIRKEYGLASPLLDKFCQISRHTDCQAVLDSQAAKLFGWLGMAEIGLLYFAGSISALLIAAYAKTLVIVLPAVAFINILTLPYSLFSVYYQAKVVRKFCPLCLCVLGVLWLELILGYPFLANFAKSYQSLSLILFCFVFSLAIWLAVKPSITLQDRVSTLTKELARFRNNTDLFYTLLQAGPAFEMNFDSNELQLGNPNATTTLTMVSGPFCAPCRRAHQLVHELVDNYGDDLNIIVRFAVSAENLEDTGNRVVTHLLSLAATNPRKVAKALDEWYENQSIELLQAKYDTPRVASASNLLAKQVYWMNQVGIQFTPTYFINDRRLPKEFKLEDMKFHLRYLIK
ncbi:cysteine peptidase family C39 domain-containing protein [Spirosoma sp. RP8]|uniref:Cysteine peptidase family C39 domain-containing protein n=2 Tax=Spirosoma liriopis TaxID=2937440 RepID=A0ABT0HTT1_9BACT|nr:cysteine peptidase family C39 domain-containing protein [Spirosoma liriopis]